jgi:hypothetical protein
MIRKSLAAAILISMTLHCASRLEILSYLYQNRQELAWSLGLIREVPITMCNSDYDFGSGLKIENVKADHALPAFAYAHEIILFPASLFSYRQPEKVLLSGGYLGNSIDNLPAGAAFTVFHPPATFA